ncbi:hypothetical protein JTB14_012868 [Gonioctena quinquepunctata]|nr:hypothetical protein JTB14_012868 [Gonioctena quinquepunctata]
MIVTTKIPAQGVIQANEKYVYKIMPPETPEQGGNSTKYFRLATSMRRALEEAKNMGRNELALIAPEELEEEKARKYIEIGARDIEMKVNFYSKKTKPNRNSWNKEDRSVVIVNSKDGKSYADLLKEVKEGVEGANIQVNRDWIRLHIRRKLKAIEDQAKLQNTEDITVRSLRPTSIGTQNATVELQESIAESLIKTGHIKVGWLSCTVRERIQLQRCYKCQQMGHVRQKCTGEDRTGDCLRCGKGGHNAKECPEENEEFCHNC